MYELNQVDENNYYIQSPAKTGFVRMGDREICLIDSGSDEDAGRRMRQMLEKNGWQLTTVYNTHPNADHIDRDRHLQEQTGCRIYAPGIECDLTNSPVLEPVSLYGGFPPKDLRHRFPMAQESRAEHLTKETLPAGTEMIPLPGYFLGMVGFRAADDVMYLVGCLSSEGTLEKYQIGLIYDVGVYLKTPERVKTMSATMFVPAHTPVTDHIAPLAQIDINKVREIAEKIADICRELLCFEQILRRLFLDYGLDVNLGQYVLIGNTARSYLTWPKGKRELETLFEDDQLLWRTVH